MEQIRMKDALLATFRRMIRPEMLTGHQYPRDASSGSPPSSAAHEEPLRKQVLEWLDRLASDAAQDQNNFALESRAFQDDESSSEGEGKQMSRTTETTTTEDSSISLCHGGPVDQSSVSSFSRSGNPHRHSYPGTTNNINNGNTNHGLSADSAAAAAAAAAVGMHPLHGRSRSPRNRGSAVPMHPVGLIAQMSLRRSGLGNRPPPLTGSIGAGSGDGMSSVGEPPLPSPMSFADIGVACPDYFVSSSYMAQRVSQLGLRRIEIDRGLSEEPKLLRKGLIVPDEVDKLFEIFYEKINVTISLLDPVLHTPATTFARCPLLFTVVCAVASRYFTERPELYSIAMHFAMTSAASSLMDSKKSVELCQAYLLLSMWPLPSRKYDEDRAWLYLGLAIRMAMDLDLHLPTNVDVTSEQQQREILNRTRTWLICYNMDRSSSAQLGKPMTIHENFIIKDSALWYQRSAYNHPYDLHLCQETTLMRIMSRFQETYADSTTPSGIKEDVDLRSTAFDFDDELVAFEKKTIALFERECATHDLGWRYRAHLIPFYINYSRLVVLSFGFQYSFSMGLLKPGDDLVMRCLEAAQNVITKMVNDEAARPYLRFAPDKHLVFASFASAFLLKLLRHKFVHLLSEDKRAPILPLVERLIRVLGDRSVSIDESHTPKIYARFLNSLLQKHRMHEESLTAQAQRAAGQEHGYDPSLVSNLGGGVNSRAGLIIDMEMLREHNRVDGSHPPPSPHPSIQITPPTAGVLPDLLQGADGALHDEHNNGIHIDEDEVMLLQGEMSTYGFDGFPGSSAVPSGSGTVHPLEDGLRDDDDELLPALKQIADPGPFWGHGMVPWHLPPATPQGAGVWESFLSNLDG
ncbi:hypothetical protein FRC17_010157 [Serendipita sp. 399]|nr:hypothetical protein FRC17_010157 [Serendipita sp. 399]